MKAAMVRFLLPVGALIVLAGCASSPYRTGYYYPSEHGQGDYYSAPAERRYDGYSSPYYYGGFYSYPYYRGGLGFYNRYPYSPYRHSRLGYSLNYGGYGPSYGFGFGYSSPIYHGVYGSPYRNFRLDRHHDDHSRDGDRHNDQDNRDHREHRIDRDRHDRGGPHPIRVQTRDTDPNRFLRRSSPDKNDPGTQRPMRFVDNRERDGSAGNFRREFDGERSEQDLRRWVVGAPPASSHRQRPSPNAEAPIQIRQTGAPPRVVQQPRFVDDRLSNGKRRSVGGPVPGQSPTLSGRSRPASVAPSTGGRSAAIDRAAQAPRPTPSPRAAAPAQSARAQSSAGSPRSVSAPKVSAPKTSGRGKVGRSEQDTADRSSENRSR